MQIDLIGKEMDMEVFANFPKCQGVFKRADGAGCLLTAFVASFGYATSSASLYGAEILSAVARLARYHSCDRAVCNRCGDFSHNCSLMHKVVREYDNGDPALALTALWGLIDLVPKKDVVTKEQVKLPCALT